MANKSVIYYKGLHMTNHLYITYPENEWYATVIFTSSCRYVTKEAGNQDDWNKLFGIRRSPLCNYINGAYLAWCYPNYPIGHANYNKIRIGWYLHNGNGKFVLMPLSETIYVDINEPVVMSIKNYSDNFVYNLNDKIIDINKSAYGIDRFSNGWRLSPNFGGQETPDHNIVIKYNLGGITETNILHQAGF